MNAEFQCKTVFTSAKGKRYSHGDIIGQSEYNTLYANEQNNFKDITPVEHYSDTLKVMSDGHLGLNLGNGMSMDLQDGSLGKNVGRLSINL